MPGKGCALPATANQAIADGGGRLAETDRRTDVVEAAGIRFLGIAQPRNLARQVQAITVTPAPRRSPPK